MATPIHKAAPTGEIGASGLTIYSGRVQDEFNPRLKGPRAQKIFREMMDNDPVIGAVLFAIEQELREVEWHAEPAAGMELDQRAIDEAEFVWGALNDMSITWAQTLTMALSMLPFGWCFAETIYKYRTGMDADPASAFEDGRVGWRSWALRAQESLSRWDFDDSGRVQAFIQRNPEGAQGETPIPMEKGLLFRTTAARGNPEGRSILRNAYRPWFFKKRIEEIEGIGIERDLAGLPVAGVPPEYLDENATESQKAVLNKVMTLVRDIKRDEQEGVIFPREIDPDTKLPRWTLELLSTGGRRQFDTDQIVSRYDQRISMTVLADFILLGHEMVGSKALGVSKVELFTKALTAYADEISAVVNRYGIPRLMQLNAVPRELWPTLVHGQIAEVNLGELGTFVKDSMLPIDPSAEDYLREQAGMPPVDRETAQA